MFEIKLAPAKNKIETIIENVIEASIKGKADIDPIVIISWAGDERAEVHYFGKILKIFSGQMNEQGTTYIPAEFRAKEYIKKEGFSPMIKGLHVTEGGSAFMVYHRA